MSLLLRILRLPVLLLALAAAPMAAAPAAAQGLSVDEAKQAGLVGERPDGLLGVIGGNGEARRLVEEVNARRLDEYRRIAERTGTTLAAVQAIAGQKLVDEAPPGTYVMTAQGRWIQK